jgi:O-antigen/teichoic acid export membrane protein
VTLILLAGLLLKLWLKHEFTEAMTGAFRIMSAGTYLSLLCVPAYYTLMGLGKVHLCLASQVIQGAANIFMICILLFFNGTVSVHRVVTVVMFSMGLTTVYVILQNRRVMQQFLNHPVNPDSFSNNLTPLESCPCIKD